MSGTPELLDVTETPESEQQSNVSIRYMSKTLMAGGIQGRMLVSPVTFPRTTSSSFGLCL